MTTPEQTSGAPRSDGLGGQSSSPPRAPDGPGGGGFRPGGPGGGGPGGPGGGGPGGPRRGTGTRGRRYYPPRRRVCGFCVEKVKTIDYKDVGRLRRFISERGRMEPRRKTGTCARHQRILAHAIKRARMLAMIPFTADHIRATGWR